MASVASQLVEEVTAYAQSDSLEDAREICADGTYFPNNLSTYSVTNRRSRRLRDLRSESEAIGYWDCGFESHRGHGCLF